jgi:hypothetical protein
MVIFIIFVLLAVDKIKAADTARRDTCRFADSVKLLVLDWIKSCRILLFVPVDQLAGFLVDNQPGRKAILEVALAFLTLSDCCLCLEFLHQRIVLGVEPLGLTAPSASHRL